MVKKAGKKTEKKEQDATQLLAGPEQQAQENYRELLLARVSEKALQERVERLTNNYKDFQTKANETIKDLELNNLTQQQKIQTLNQQLRETRTEKQQLETEIEQLKDKIDKNQKNHEELIEELNIQHINDIKIADQKYKSLLSNYEMLNQYKEDKAQKESEIERLKKMLDDEKVRHNNELSNLEREKIQSEDRLKKEVLAKIKQTKTKLMALNDQQLHSTTKLTVLENHRLTQELEYQSKQTEKLLYKNAQLQEQVQGLKRDIEVHKQVEAELAKRSHHYQKVIKKYIMKLKQIEETNNIQISIQSSVMESHDASSRSLDAISMEQKLIAYEAQIRLLQQDLNQSNKDKEFFKQKVESFATPLTNLNTLLRDYMNNFQTFSQSEISSEEVQRLIATPQQE